MTNLHYFHRFARFEETIPGSFAKVPKWKRKCIHGKVERHRWKREGREDELTVVKIMGDQGVSDCRALQPNDWAAWRPPQEVVSPEDALNEIGVYSYLRAQDEQCPYVLRMHCAFRDAGLTWVVLENCDGGDLLDFVEKQRDTAGGLIGEDILKGYMWQILQAVRHLHAHNIGHRDISLENLLLRGGQVRLMDFGQACQLHSRSGDELRYFRLCGKNYYRGPECYMPHVPGLQVQAHCPADSTPGTVVMVAGGGYLINVRFPQDAVPGEAAIADLYGYAAAPMDMFACGVAFFIMHAQVPPWQLAQLQNDGFTYVFRHGVGTLLTAWQKPMSAEATELLAGLLNHNPSVRFTVERCLESPWFDSMRGPGAGADDAASARQLTPASATAASRGERGSSGGATVHALSNGAGGAASTAGGAAAHSSGAGGAIGRSGDGGAGRGSGSVDGNPGAAAAASAGAGASA